MKDPELARVLGLGMCDGHINQARRPRLQGVPGVRASLHMPDPAVWMLEHTLCAIRWLQFGL